MARIVAYDMNRWRAMDKVFTFLAFLEMLSICRRFPYQGNRVGYYVDRVGPSI